MSDYVTVTPDAELEKDLRALVQLSKAEDLRGEVDWTTVCLIGESVRGACQVVPRQGGPLMLFHGGVISPAQTPLSQTPHHSLRTAEPR